MQINLPIIIVVILYEVISIAFVGYSVSKKSKNIGDVNFIEGMACVGGCIGGAGCLTHGEKNKAEVDKYGQEALEKTILDAVSVLK